MKVRFRSGAASFYVVAFSTLILTIIAASFATAIIAAVTRAANDDLSQSAYDAALAGVEDAKLAFISYQNCLKSGITIDENYDPLKSGPDITCQDIIYWMEHPDCDMVAHILGRIGKEESGEVLIDESTGSDNEMNQAYTCAMIDKNPSDYKGTLSGSSPYKIVRVGLADVEAEAIKSVRISWALVGDNKDDLKLNFNNIIPEKNRVGFRSLNGGNVSVPPMLAVRLLQTEQQFKLEDLNGGAIIDDGSSQYYTDRATMYFVPTDDSGMAAAGDGSTYEGVYNQEKGKNILTARQVASTNDKKKDLPYLVYCSNELDSEYICSVRVELPRVISDGGYPRDNDTFMFEVALPYAVNGQSNTDFVIEYFCDSKEPCGHDEESLTKDENGYYEDNIAVTDNIQITVDSTGRANDLYRRIEVRLGPEDDADAISWYAIQAYENGGPSIAIDKNIFTTKEFGL